MNESWIDDFEDALHQLEQLTTQPSTFSEVYTAALQAAGWLGTSPNMEFLLNRDGSLEKLLPDGSAEPVPKTPDPLPDDSSNDISKPNNKQSTYAAHEAVADGILLTAKLQFDKVTIPADSMHNAVQAIVSLLSGLIRRHVLNQYQQQFIQQGRLLTVLEHLIDAPDRTAVANIVAQDAAACFDDVRIAVISGSPSQRQALAVTGVDSIDQQAHAVLELKSLVDVDQANSSARCLTLSPSLSVPTAIVLDGKGAAAIPETALNLLQQAANRAFLRTDNRFWSRLFPKSRVQKIAYIFGIGLLLFLWPMNFEIEVNGRLQPVKHRRIFAPQDGVIEQVLFANEQQLTQGQTFLVIRNDDVQREVQNLKAEVDNVKTRLATVTALKLSGADPNASVNERLLQTELESLSAELDVALKKRNSLTLNCPFAGFVYRQDPQSSLLNRPVVRGQWLGEIVEAESPWQIELDIPDDVRRYIQESVAQETAEVQVRSYLRSRPEQEFVGQLKTLEQATQFIDGKLISRALVSADTLSTEDCRPGVSVVSRINCGRRSAAFVAFREVVEFADYLVFLFWK